MRKLVASAAITAAAVLGLPALAQTGTVTAASAPGKAAMKETIKGSATITAIDAKTRDVTLKGAEGKEITVTAGSAVKNFDKLKVGDKVDFEYVQALSIELKKGGGMPVARTEQAAATGAKPGAEPAGMVGRQITVVANVVALDPAKQIVTLQGPQHTVDLHVVDPAQFKLVAKGDQVEATYTQALAMAVVPSAK